MKTDEAKYSLLRDSVDFQPRDESRALAWRLRSHWTYTITIALLILSVVLNIFQFVMSEQAAATCTTPYADLLFNVEEKMWWDPQYGNLNDSAAFDFWDHDIPWESGVIALGKDEAAAMGLQESQSWPWDAEHKAIYIVNAHHILHCVRNLYLAIHQYRHGLTQTVMHAHIVHCLDALRLETMCTADDTPRYVPPNGIKGLRPGEGQPRKCRDWQKLQRFVDEHDPCYKYIHPGDESILNLERFKYCRNDSPYLPTIRKFFGYPEDWEPWPFKEQEDWVLAKDFHGGR